MAEVYIDSLTVENFGPYYGKHNLVLTPLDDRCGILIGGKNGAGKTHLLRAMYLAVVGESGVVDLKKVEPASEATRFTFENSLNRRAQAEGQDTVRLTIGISQRDEDGGGRRKANLVREIRYRLNSPPAWRSWAEKADDGSRIEDEDRLTKFRDGLLPRHLARFFFFDAERGQNFSLSQNEIVDGITRILGLWSYEELETDLRNLIQQKIPRVYNSKEAHEGARRLAELAGAILTREKELAALHEELKSLAIELHESQAELVETEERLRSLGAVDPAELDRAQEKRTQLAEAKLELESKLRGAWEKAMPVALLGTYRQELYDALIKEEKRREWESSKATVEPKIPQVKRDIFEDVAPEFRLTEKIKEFYVERVEKALHSLFHPPPEGMAESAFITDRNDRSAQIRAQLAGSAHGLKGIAELCAQIESVDANLREWDTKIKQLRQNSAAISQGAVLYQKRGELSERCEQLERQQADLNARVSALIDEIRELKREETNHTELATKARQGQTLISLASRYRDAAAEIRSRAAVQLRRQISEYVGDLWVNITERQREFTGMEFDTNWQCYLLRRDGGRSTWEEVNTSAGQRQVRMLSFYEALRRLARLVPPLVVDTPLGRLDKEVKDSVLDQMYLSGHQCIILTTNSEIDPEGPLLDRIRDKVARVYTLHPHGKEDSPNYEVRVTNDYFGRTL